MNNTVILHAVGLYIGCHSHNKRQVRIAYNIYTVIGLLDVRRQQEPCYCRETARCHCKFRSIRDVSNTINSTDGLTLHYVTLRYATLLTYLFTYLLA